MMITISFFMLYLGASLIGKQKLIKDKVVSEQFFKLNNNSCFYFLPQIPIAFCSKAIMGKGF